MKIVNIRKIIKNNQGYNEEYIDVDFAPTMYGYTWRPKIADLVKMIVLIAEMEERKYKFGKGKEYLREYINKAIDGIDINILDKEYKMPYINKKTGFTDFCKGC